MKITFISIAVFAGLAHANLHSGPSSEPLNISLGTASATTTVTFNYNNAGVWDAFAGMSANDYMLANIGIGSHVVGISFDVTIDTIGGHLLSEVAFASGAVGGADFLTLAPGSADVMPGTGSYSDSFDLVGIGFDYTTDSGLVFVEWHTIFGNDPLIQDAVINGSFTIQYKPVPAPKSLALLGLSGLVASRRRR